MPGLWVDVTTLAASQLLPDGPHTWVEKQEWDVQAGSQPPSGGQAREPSMALCLHQQQPLIFLQPQEGSLRRQRRKVWKCRDEAFQWSGFGDRQD